MYQSQFMDGSLFHNLTNYTKMLPSIQEKECEVFNLTTGPEVISNLWRYLGSLMI